VTQQVGGASSGLCSCAISKAPLHVEAQAPAFPILIVGSAVRTSSKQHHCWLWASHVAGSRSRLALGMTVHTRIYATFDEAGGPRLPAMLLGSKASDGDNSWTHTFTHFRVDPMARRYIVELLLEFRGVVQAHTEVQVSLRVALCKARRLFKRC
jgi:hypothetical protein